MTYETTSRYRILEYDNSGKLKADTHATDLGAPRPMEEPSKRRAWNLVKAVALLVVVAVLCVVFFSAGERIAEQRITHNSLSAGHANTPPPPPVNPESAGASSTSQAAPASEQETPQASQPPGAVVLKWEPSLAPGPTHRTIVLQVAALTRQDDASAMAATLQARQYPAFVRLPTTDNFYRVQVGPYPDLRSASTVKRSLELAGYEVIITR